MTLDIHPYEYLWTSDSWQYVLVNAKGMDSLAGYGIFHIIDRSALLIEDEALHAEVVRRMIAAGVKVVNKLPMKQSGPKGSS